MDKPTTTNSGGGIEEWRTQSKALGQILRFALDRTYLEAQGSDLARHLRPVRQLDPVIPIRWLRLECVGAGDSLAEFDPLVAMRIALSSCHRPGMSRVYFMVCAESHGCSIYLGIRGLGPTGDSESMARAVQSFAEGAWPATKLRPVPDSDEIERRWKATVESPGRRFALTGVPVPQSSNSRSGCGLESLLDGLAGKSFTLLVIADPIEAPAQEEMLGRIRDILGAVHILQRMHVTRTQSTTRTIGTSKTISSSTSTAHQTGRSKSAPAHSRLHKVLDLITVGGVAVAPFYPPAAFAAGLAGLVRQVLPRDLTESESESVTTTEGRSVTDTQSESTSDSESEAVAREYVSAHLQAVSCTLERLAARTQGSKMWDVGVYVLSSDDDDAHDAAAQLGTLLNGPRTGGEEPIRMIDLQPSWRHGVAADLAAGRRPLFELGDPETDSHWMHPLGRNYEGLSTPLTSDELALLCSLPRREVPGIRVRPFASFGVNPAGIQGSGLRIGSVLRGDQPTGAVMSVTLESLSKNALVTGTVGSGKTSTVKSMLRQLQAQGVPFLVIEPAKSEYLDWALRWNEMLPPDSPQRIAIYSPGLAIASPDTYPLKLNPFYVESPELLTMHIERLKTLLIGSLPMQEALPMLVESVLYALYRHHGWFDENEKQRRWPTVTGALVTKAKNSVNPSPGKPEYAHANTLLAAVVLEKGYEERVAHSFIGALRTRLGFLAEPGSWKSTLFDCARSTPAQELFARPAVVNLSALHADRPFVAGLLLGYLHESRHANRGLGQLQQVTVLEEAHCLLEPSRHVGAEAMDPKGMLSNMCAEMLSEMRAWGQGFIIVDQYPTRLIADAVKNTNLKIVHRLPARDDQEIMSAAMSLTDGQRRILPFLRPGQAVVIGDQDDAPMRVQMPFEKEGRS